MLDIKSIVTCIEEEAKLEANISVGILKTMPEVKSLSSCYSYDKKDNTEIYTKELHVKFYIFGLSCELYTVKRSKWVLKGTDGRYDSKVIASFWWDAASGRFSRCRRLENMKTGVEEYVVKQIEKVLISISEVSAARYAIPCDIKIGRYSVHTVNSEIICKDDYTDCIYTMHNDILGMIMKPSCFPTEVFDVIKNNYMINREEL